jgi:hypothetical protein
MPRKTKGIPPQKPAREVSVATYLPTDSGELCTHCKASWTGFKADPRLATPPVPPADVEKALSDLGNALEPAENGGEVDTALVQAAARKVRTIWGQLGKYVQAVLRANPSVDAQALLAGVLMYESKVGTHKPKPPLGVKDGPTSGTARVAALAILHALTYTWEWSTDQANWSSTTTGQSHVLLTGLTPGQKYYVRVRAFLRDGTTTDWVLTLGFIAR